VPADTEPSPGPTTALRRYLAAMGGLLLAQGTASLALRAGGVELAPLAQAFVNADPLHAVVHVAWGLALLLAALFAPSPRPLAGLALVFGVFYSGLALLGTAVHHPLGLLLGLGENVFHFVVGPITLLLGARAWRASASDAPAQPSAPVSVGK
jgi:hypothetical protein